MRGSVRGVLSWEDGLKAPATEGIEAIVFRTLGNCPRMGGDFPRSWRIVQQRIHPPAFFIPFMPYFDERISRPSTSMETYLRLMLLKFRYRRGYEGLCRTFRTQSPGGCSNAGISITFHDLLAASGPFQDPRGGGT